MMNTPQYDLFPPQEPRHSRMSINKYHVPNVAKSLVSSMFISLTNETQLDLFPETHPKLLSVLRLQISEHIDDELLEKAFDVFEDMDMALGHFYAHNESLGGKAPIELLQEDQKMNTDT